MLGHARHHLGADFLVVVKAEDEVRLAVAGEGTMRARLPLLNPSFAQERGKHPTGFGGSPSAHGQLRCLEGDGQEFRNGFAVLQAFR